MTNLAAATDFLGLTRGRSPLGEEQVGVDAEAVRVVVPIGIRFDRDGADRDARCGDELHVGISLRARRRRMCVITPLTPV